MGDGQGAPSRTRYAAAVDALAKLLRRKPRSLRFVPMSGHLAPSQRTERIKVLRKVELQEVAAALLDQVVSGFEKDTLLNDDLARIGQEALCEEQKA